ncbi:hypothetical protein, partial [Bacteroides nordii]
RLCKLREGCQCGRIYEGGEGYDGTRDSVRIKAIVVMKKGEGSCTSSPFFIIATYSVGTY